MSDQITRIWNYTNLLQPFNLKRTNKLFQNHTNQLKAKIVQDVTKVDSGWYGKIWVITQSLNAQLISINYKARKNKYGSYSNSYNCFLHFKFFAWNIKNQIGSMYTVIDFEFYSSWVRTQKLTRNYTSICPRSWHNEKSLAQLGTQPNILNNYIKLSGFTFRLDVTETSAPKKVLES